METIIKRMSDCSPCAWYATRWPSGWDIEHGTRGEETPERGILHEALVAVDGVAPVTTLISGWDQAALPFVVAEVTVRPADRTSGLAIVDTLTRSGLTVTEREERKIKAQLGSGASIILYPLHPCSCDDTEMSPHCLAHVWGVLGPQHQPPFLYLA